MGKHQYKLIVLLDLAVLVMCALIAFSIIRPTTSANAPVKDSPVVQENYVTIDEDKIERNDALVASINSQPRLILQSITGTKTVSCHRWDESQKFKNLFARSDIEIDCQYDVAFVLDPKGFYAQNVDGRTYIQYDTKYITIEYVDFKDTDTRVVKSLFGTAYTPQDTITMIEDAKESLKEELYTQENIDKCEENFIAYIDSLARDCGIDDYIIFHAI